MVSASTPTVAAQLNHYLRTWGADPRPKVQQLMAELAALRNSNVLREGTIVADIGDTFVGALVLGPILTNPGPHSVSRIFHHRAAKLGDQLDGALESVRTATKSDSCTMTLLAGLAGDWKKHGLYAQALAKLAELTLPLPAFVQPGRIAMDEFHSLGFLTEKNDALAGVILPDDGWESPARTGFGALAFAPASASAAQLHNLASRAILLRHSQAAFSAELSSASTPAGQQLASDYRFRPGGHLILAVRPGLNATVVLGHPSLLNLAQHQVTTAPSKQPRPPGPGEVVIWRRGLFTAPAALRQAAQTITSYGASGTTMDRKLEQAAPSAITQKVC